MKYKQIYIIGGKGVMGTLLNQRITIPCRDFFSKAPILYDKGDILSFEDGTIDEPTLIIICVPILETDKVIKKIFEAKVKHAYVTEIGSVKGKLVDKYYDLISRKELKSGSCFFVSSHCMAGPMASDWNTLVWDKVCLLIEHKNNPIFEPIKTFWKELGFKIKNIKNEDHNRVIGKLSHLSHFMIMKYVEYVEKTCSKEDLELAGTSWDKFKQLSEGAKRLNDIYVTNEELPKLCKEFSKVLNHD